MTGHSLHVLDCGTMTLQRQAIYFMEGSEPLTIPLRAFVITHPSGNVLFDGGLPLELIEDPGHWEWIHAMATWNVGPHQHVRAQVEGAGIDPASIRYVIQSHLHFDHIGAIGHFPAAEFVTHRREWEYAHHPQEWISAPYYPVADIDRPDVRWRFIDCIEDAPEHDLYGDRRIRLIFSPGHSPGHLSALTQLDDQLVMLTGDAADSAAHWRRETLPPYLDLPAVAHSLDALHQLEAAEAVDLVFFAHDLEQDRTMGLSRT